VQEEAKGLPFETHRVDAVNAKDLQASQYVSSGVNAAWLSHLKAIQMFLQTDYDFALISEDDFHVKDVNELVEKIRSLEISQWDLIQFGFLKPGIDTRIKILISHTESFVFRIIGRLSQIPLLANQRFASRMRVRQSLETPKGFVIDDCQPGAHFYLVSRSFCQSIAALNEPQFLSIDDFYTSLSKMRTFKMLRVKRNLVTQKPFSAWVGPRFKRSL
jgi:GR25 family glycosyltransferase involved in LPS biosynthesis